MKSLFITVFLFFSMYKTNIWDNLYSNQDGQLSDLTYLRDSNTRWKFTNTFIFRDYSLDAWLSPVKNKLFLQLFNKEKSFMRLFIDFQTNEVAFNFGQQICKKIILPDLVKLNLNNLNNMWDFLFFKQNDKHYTLELPFNSLKGHLPTVDVFFKQDSEEEDYEPDEIHLLFVTKTMILKNSYISNKNLDFHSIMDYVDNCDISTNIKLFFENFSGKLVGNLIQDLLVRFKLIDSKDKEADN